MTINERTDKHNVHTQDGILFGLKKEVLIHVKTCINLEDIRLSETSQSQEDKYYDSAYMKYLSNSETKQNRKGE